MLYDGGVGGAGCDVVEIEQISSRYFLNSTRWVERNAFIGSIQASFVPNDDILASPCSDFAMSVKVLRAFVFGWSVELSATRSFLFGLDTYLLASQIAWD